MQAGPLRALASVAAVLAAATAVDAQPRAAVTFNQDIAPIIYANCVSCHRPGESAPFSLLTYEDVKQRARLIAEVTSRHFMPPWQPDSRAGEFAGERRLSPEQIQTLGDWAEAGAPEGESARRPSPPVLIDGWQLGPPDIVVTMSEPFTVPAGGPDVFRNFVLPIPLADRKYVRAFELRPGNPRVLHHARILVDDSGEVRRLDARDPQPGFGGMEVPGGRFPDGHFLGWSPGKRPTREAFPWPIEPGTDFVIQMHLKPSGRAEAVQASIGLYLTDAAPAASPLMVRLGSKTIDIPPGAASYEVTDSYVLPVDVTVLSVYPHAHYLAKEMTVGAKRPDGTTHALLHIPNWDFNWQDEYSYTRPVSLPAGTTLTMRYTYDNSAENPHNPGSPPRRVRFGAGTTDEMGELLVQVLPASSSDLARLRADIARKTFLGDIAGEEKRIADVPDDYETRNALGVAYIQLGRVADAVAQFEASLRIAPAHAVAHYNLGVIALAEKRLDEARDHFDRALAARPDYVEAHNNLGILLESQGRIAEAAGHYQQALAARPTHVAAHNNLGRVLLGRGAVGEAIAHFRTALRTAPENADVLYNLGRALVADRQPAEAVRTWRRALVARPGSLPVLVDLAWVLATNPDVQNPEEAVRLAERANQAAGGPRAAVLDVLAAAYAASGRTEAAIRTAQTAIRQALAEKNDALAAEIRQRLELYQQPGASDAFDRRNP